MAGCSESSFLDREHFLDLLGVRKHRPRGRGLDGDNYSTRLENSDHLLHQGLPVSDLPSAECTTSRVTTYTRDHEPGVDDIETVVRVGHPFDSVALLESSVAGHFGSTSPVGGEVDTKTGDLWELGGHLDNPDSQL